MIISVDDYGNKLEKFEIKKGFEYKLYLKSLGYSRKIWKEINWKLVLVRENSHIHIKTNSYGFNVKLLESYSFDTLVIIKNKSKPFPYQVLIWDIIKFWFYLQFLDKWFEKQIFYPINNLRYFTWKI